MVPAERRFEVTERLDHDGRVMTALDPDSVEDAIGRVEASGAEAVAVSLLHAYANPAHEEALGARLRARFPYVALSAPGQSRGARVRAHGDHDAQRRRHAARGGVHGRPGEGEAGTRPACTSSTPPAAWPRPRRSATCRSASRPPGPAAGVAAAGSMARALGLERAISFDMGGTTTDVCLILDGRGADHERPLARRAAAASADGGGGVHRRGWRLHRPARSRLAPWSARRAPAPEPGPACYAKGGERPTVTDANLLLGYMDSDRVLGGDVHLDPAAARESIAPLGAAMGMTAEAAALGVVRVANAAMLRALRRVTVERGMDGRTCTLLAFGGAGPCTPWRWPAPSPSTGWWFRRTPACSRRSAASARR